MTTNKKVVAELLVGLFIMLVIPPVVWLHHGDDGDWSALLWFAVAVLNFTYGVGVVRAAWARL